MNDVLKDVFKGNFNVESWVSLEECGNFVSFGDLISILGSNKGKSIRKYNKSIRKKNFGLWNI